MKTVLVAGASGLVGRKLTALLSQKGYRIHTLSNSQSTDRTKQRFQWSPEEGTLDVGSLEGVELVVNLSGAGLFDHRWSKQYKQKIINSRTKSTAVLVDAIVREKVPIQAFVNASATGIYGIDTGDNWVDENTPPANDFLAEVVKQWEASLLTREELKARKVCLRFGIVLAREGGALPQLSAPVKAGIGSALGSGLQYISWIHVDDLCHMILFALENSALEGPYNAVSDEPVTNETMVKEIARQTGRKLWAPHVPAFALNIILGKERAATLLGGSKVKNEKMKAAGFEWEYKTLSQALHSLFSSKE